MNRRIHGIRGRRNGRKSVFRVFRPSSEAALRRVDVFGGLCFLPLVAASPRCVHQCPSMVLLCLGTASTQENYGLGSTNRPSQNNT